MCSVCHRHGNPDFPKARALKECLDCHAERPRDYFFLGGEGDLGLSIRVEGGSPGEVERVRAEFGEWLAEQELPVAPDAEATWRADCAFRVVEVSDEYLVPAASGVRLLRGSVEIKLDLGSDGSFRSMIASRVHATREPARTRREILGWLVRAAFRYVGFMIEEET